MSLPIVLRPEAEDDLVAAQTWYEQQRLGLGDEFADEVEDVFARVEFSPKLYAEVLPGVRRCKLRKFPYVVYYRILANQIEVIGVLHGRRDPQVWRNRAGN
jgi:toxin ParE1/3/4